jgi:hypothetical protein
MQSYRKYISNQCPNCGEIHDGQFGYCDMCRFGRQIKRRNKRLQLYQRAVQALGGECTDCKLKTNVVFVYDFRSIEPLKKTNIHYLISHGEKWETIESILPFHVLLCANCNRMRGFKSYFPQLSKDTKGDK